MKKFFNSPYLRVVAVKNDIIATSGTTEQISVRDDISGPSKVAGRDAWDEEDW